MDTYRGEKIIADLTARLEATDSNLPDCICEVCMSKEHIYVLEDNYDGTYTAHFTLGLREVEDLILHGKQKGMDNLDPDSASIIFSAIATLLSCFGGIHVYSSKKRAKTISPYLEIKVSNGMGGYEHIYLCELRNNPKRLIKEFQRIKKYQSDN